MTPYGLTWAVLALFQWEDEHPGLVAQHWKWWSLWRYVDDVDQARGRLPSVWN